MSSGTQQGQQQVLEKSIQKWVELDNELKRNNDKIKEIRNKKNEIEEKIMTYVETNKMEKSTIQISDGKIRFVETKQTSPITLTFLEQCLSELITNENQVQQIMQYIKEKRETKVIPEIKRYYNN
jgi:hypothetical protein